jgi:hypothetical protein
MKGNIVEIIYIGMPIFFILSHSILMIFHASQKDFSISGGCITGAKTAGILNSIIEVFIIFPLVKNGTDGPGGLIIVILPFFSFILSIIIGVIFGIIGEIFFGLKGTNTNELSDQAQTIINSSKLKKTIPQEKTPSNGPLNPLPSKILISKNLASMVLQNVSVSLNMSRSQNGWRDFVRKNSNKK